jgi:hypothetical protein
MRDLKDFTVADWLQLLPLQHAFKQVRNDAILAVYKRLRPKSLEPFLAETCRFAGKNIVLVIAFEQPWALDWLLRMAGRNLTDATVLVFDNSRRREVRVEIEKVCRARAVPYLALPPNPTRHVNRSHGMAMSWIFDNVVRAIKPRIFGFIDHDMIPVEEVRLAERLGAQPFFGRLKGSNLGWQLWAGYCLFDFARVSGLPLNFLYDFSLNLDTGGRNWACLYQPHPYNSVEFSAHRLLKMKDPATGELRKLQFVDDRWLHLGAIGYNNNLIAKLKFCQYLEQSLDQGTKWSQLCRDLCEPLENKHSTS